MNNQQRHAAKNRRIARPSLPAGPAADLFVAAVRHHAEGRLDEAQAHYRHILAAHPDHADSAFNLGVLLRQLGNLEDAIAAYGQALRIDPDYPEAHFNLGNALVAAGKPAEAINAYARALRTTPDHARARVNLGLAYAQLGVALTNQSNYEAAATAFAEAIALNPDGAETHYNLGNVRKCQGRLDDAASSYARAIALNPSLAEAHSNLGNTLAELGRLDEAVIAHSRAIAIKPASAEMHFNLGNALKDRNKPAAAAAAYKQALAVDPNHAGANANLGIVLMNQGQIDEAIAAYTKAVTLRPDDSDTFSNLLFCRNYDARLTPAELFSVHSEWDARYSAPFPLPANHTNDRTPGRRLRVGYVSPDFRTHSVGYFLAPLFERRARNDFEVFCYADVLKPDVTTDRLRNLADHWLSTVGMPHDAMARRIQSDRIDILVDLAGHTSHNRLRVFARKPAPVQVTYLGYSNTTGVRAIDYRLVDDITDPSGAADAAAAETLYRLPGGFLCYSAPKDAPQPSQPPCLNTGTVTFGSFNNPAKVSDPTFDVWARLLTELPDARLLLKGKPFADDATRATFLSRLAERGIARERVELISWLPSMTAHLALYERIDVALDPFPYNGTTTTCEALWMGVPVVTLQGDRHSARVGASLLTQTGMTDCITGSLDDYVRAALALANDQVKLKQLRRDLRRRVAASSLCDADAFARKLENAYRSMWRHWCERSTFAPAS